MKLLFYLGHPAHFHLFKPTINILSQKGHEFIITIKSKDVLSDLLNGSGLPFINLSTSIRKNSQFSILLGLFNRDFKLFWISKRFKPDILVGSAAEIAHVGRLLNIPSLVLFEDDLKFVPQFAKIAAPFADLLICPEACSAWKWKYKTIQYNSYHELAYLAPKYFKPNFNNVINFFKKKDRVFLIRFAKLTAYHDQGKKGISKEIAIKMINILKPHGKIYISSERELESEFEKYRININPMYMHDILYYSDLYIGDSQTMTAEAAVLGTPSLRFNDFVGKLGYLEELEKSYSLTYGIKTNKPEQLLSKITEIISVTDLKRQWLVKKEKMLREKIDLTAFLVWFFENYPNSRFTIEKNPEYQYNFKLVYN